MRCWHPIPYSALCELMENSSEESCPAPRSFILEGLKTKVLHAIIDPLWFATNKDIFNDLEMPTVEKLIAENSDRYLND